MEDKKIICRDCGEEFIFSVREQEFYQQQGFENDPVRCKACRQKRKAERANRPFNNAKVEAAAEIVENANNDDNANA